MTDGETAKCRPAMFNGAMVRALLDGSKTQTRRPVAPPPRNVIHSHPAGGGYWAYLEQTGYALDDHFEHVVRSPLGEPGDQLWVRERARIMDVDCTDSSVLLRYEADGHVGEWMPYPDRLKPVAAGKCIPNGCFLEASRITLEITGVRVERVQDISEDDAEAEGVDSNPDAPASLTHKGAFAGLWDGIYSARGLGWEANPYVWAYEFRVVS